MMENETERAKSFWAEVDVDGAFDELMEVLTHLRHAIRDNTATDRELVQAMTLVLDSKLPAVRSEAFEEVLVDEDILTVTVSESQGSPESLRNGAETEEQRDASRCVKDVDLSPLSSVSEEPCSPVPLVFRPHACSAACVPRLPAHAHLLLGQNPLRAPMLCGFRRQRDPCKGVAYVAPCGRSLRCMEAVMRFLRCSYSLGVLQPENFSFHPQVCPEQQTRAPVLLERDLSRGVEPVPVALLNELDAERPGDFRYRRERWPHGCFLSSAPLFSVCCDCTDGCTDPQRCACVQETLADTHTHAYTHQRLSSASSGALWECGPWCGCERSLCQNRVVQKGLRVRLQVFRTPEHRWGLRCRDDLDRGTFVCIYAGVVLRQQRIGGAPVEPRGREQAVSDDEVEVVEEWTLPGPREALKQTRDGSPPLYVPVIQRPADQGPAPRSSHEPSGVCSDHEHVECEEILQKKPRLTASNGHACGAETSAPDPQEMMYYLDASKEGNVARFINHSCDPNLFIQNVFTDTHDPQFPLVAFFTSRMVKAGTELTWKCWED